MKSLLAPPAGCDVHYRAEQWWLSSSLNICSSQLQLPACLGAPQLHRQKDRCRKEPWTVVTLFPSWPKTHRHGSQGGSCHGNILWGVLSRFRWELQSAAFLMNTRVQEVDVSHRETWSLTSHQYQQEIYCQLWHHCLQRWRVREKKTSYNFRSLV